MWLVIWVYTVTLEQSRTPSCGLRDSPVGSLWRRRGHELRVWVWWVFPVLGLDSLNRAVQILQKDFLSDGLLNAFTHSWGEKNKHTQEEGSYYR